ncbi:MAG: FAD-dependent oxidoreductase, partial [Bilophila sp.]
MSKRVIVIGGVALGPKAASRLKRLDPSAEVTMIDENTNISFGGCGIPYYVSGEVSSLDALRATTYGAIRTPDYFKDLKDITVRNKTRVLSIDKKAHTVVVRDLPSGAEETLPYDKLILGTGSLPKVPPVEGRELTGVTGANNLENAHDLHEICASGKATHAVVIGGGFIGMEIAVALADMWDIKTAVVEFLPQVMPGVLSAPLADMVAHDLQANNVSV